MSAARRRVEDPRLLARRVAARAWRAVNPASTAGLGWKRQGEHITFKWSGFVEAPTDPLLFARHHYETRLIRQLLASDPPARTLEFGCGYGRLSPTFAELSGSHTAVDINAEALEAARAAYPDLTFLAVDSEHLPFPDGSFDLVATWTVIQHIPPHRIDRAIAELMRVRSAEGRVLLCEETRDAGSPSQHSWHREPSFYERAFHPLQMTHSSYVEEIDRLAGLRSPGRVMLFEPLRASA